MVDEVRSTVRDVQAIEWGGTGVITCIVDQAYDMGGECQEITAPTSLTLRREDGDWKIAVFHSVPMPD